jgi:hypothetical protein
MSVMRPPFARHFRTISQFSRQFIGSFQSLCQYEFLTGFDAVAIMPAFAHDPIIWLPMSDMQQNVDFRQFLSDNPEVDQIEQRLPDNNGILRGKRVPAENCRRMETLRFDANISPLAHDRFLRPA